ncbi:helix-turn-helix transcriptional regulator [Salmonella enterica]|nr:XRE family transcriptional regulator [Salmonella enterica]ECW8874891.1 helix-turn-helix transcriptional regulator [Salmonella enterica]EIL1177585.1 helix-turn-helix transcriptional regulator [Salmonella enterica]EIO9954969.1 helix-turn-helix transcriptional regulator [Salmonella enterica]EIV5116126.1 helix-turn-helix transcriptional regulator [Salmonella enterica]
MKVKGIPYSEVKAKALQNPDVMAAYLVEKKEEELQELLADMRRKAGINSTQVAERMGITQPAVSKLEKNASKASITTLERYAAACGASIKIVMG